MPKRAEIVSDVRHKWRRAAYALRVFARVKRSAHGDRAYEYIQICRSVRDGATVRQQVVATLGRKDELLASGELDGLVRSLARYSEKVRVVEAARGIKARTSKSWGPALVFGRLWERQRVGTLLSELSQGRRFGFDVERVAFALALQRLCAPGSDLQGSGWLHTVEAPEFESIELQHMYRACRFLAEIRETIEQKLFWADRDLFSDELDLVFIDTTSIYVYRDTETEWRKRGYSRDRRGDLPQFVLCVAVDQRGWPIAWEVFPGNTGDREALRAVVIALRKRFQVRRVTVVADRGMIGATTIDMLTKDLDAPFDYILGCRMRNHREVRDHVLARAGRYHPVADNLEVKEVCVGANRYIVCRNPIEAESDRRAREAILAKFEDGVSHRKRKLGNRGYARFFKLQRGSISIDMDAVEADARYDGKFVLTTNTTLSAEEVALAYKSLWRVERTFREEKCTLDVRPIYHHLDTTSIGHIVGCFLALRLEVDLQIRLDERNIAVSWPDLMRDLSQVQCVVIDIDGTRYKLRTDLIGAASQAFIAAGVRPPPIADRIGDIPPDAAAAGAEM